MPWDDYHQAVGLQPNTIVPKLCGEYPHKRNAALDLGCGNLRDSLYLRQSGFKRIVAVDIYDPPEMFDGIEFHRSSIEQFVPAASTFDLAICCNALFYVGKEDMLLVLARIYESLASDGIFFCNLSGSKDEWVATHNWIGHSEDDVQRLLLGFNSSSKRHSGKKTMVNGVEKFSDTWYIRVIKE